MKPPATDIVYFNSFPSKAGWINLSNKLNPADSITGLVGYGIIKTSKTQLLEELFHSILLHDKTAIEPFNIIDLIDLFGFNDTIELLKSNSFQILNSVGIKPMLLLQDDKLRTIFYRDSDTTYSPIDAISYLDKYLDTDYQSRYKTERNTILLLAENNLRNIDSNLTETIESTILSELNYDLNNINLRKSLNLQTINYNSAEKSEGLKILRMINLNRTLILSKNINASTIHLDAEIQNYLSFKLSPILKEIYEVDKSFKLFSEITSKKRIPNIGELYSKQILSIKDIIALRNDINGKIFRSWFKSVNYDENEVFEKLLSSSRSIRDNIKWRLFSWIAPTAIGLASPVLGIISSISSSLTESLLTSWHPNMFLDKILKKTIDAHINDFKTKEEHERYKMQFPKIGRNDPCPCNSGKKYKNCHGRIK